MSGLPENVLIAFGALAALVVVIAPIALRLAGLTGSQIVDVLTMTARFVIDLVRAYRDQNSNGAN